MPQTITVETTDISPTGEKRILSYAHDAARWTTAQGGDLLILDPSNQPIAIYARGVWRRAIVAPPAPVNP